MCVQKRKDIFKAYERALKEFGGNARFMAKNAIIEKAMSYMAPQFYVTYDLARRVISQMRRGKDPGINNPLKKRMYDEIFKRFQAQAHDSSSYLVLEDIINSEAPSFYIDKPHFIRIVTTVLKGG